MSGTSDGGEGRARDCLCLPEAVSLAPFVEPFFAVRRRVNRGGDAGGTDFLDWTPPAGSQESRDSLSSRSWAMTEMLISRGRIGCVPGVDFGANGENHIRFCFARDRAELTGALESMRSVFREA